MNSLLERFGQVEIQNENRVSEEDLNFCKRQEESYVAAVSVWKDTQKMFQEVIDEYGGEEPYYFQRNDDYRVYLNKSEDMNFSEKRITNMKDDFISRICWYFEKKYKVSIETYEIRKKYQSDITHQDIIDEIFVQLDGLDFEEKAIQELKDAVRQRFDRGVEVKNKKITISGAISLDHFDKKWDGTSRLGYGCRESVFALFKGLSHFEYDDKVMAHLFSHVADVWISEKNDSVFKKHDLHGEKIESVKPFKNGKVELNFATRELAREFAAGYLNHA